MDQNNALKLSDVFSLIQQFIQFYKSFKKRNFLFIIGFMVICLLYYPIEKSKGSGKSYLSSNACAKECFGKSHDAFMRSM